ncbi:MAG: DUF423 domain-containing protein [Candidatus Neomarinimicrobiota bacterium]
MKNWLIIGALMAALSVMIGAFGAHGLKSRVNSTDLEIFETGVKYQMYHSLGLILIGIIGFHFRHDILTTPALLLFFGTIVFSGSLYVLVLSNLRWFGAVTPLGGICLVLGWILLSLNIFRY